MREDIIYKDKHVHIDADCTGDLRGHYCRWLKFGNTHNGHDIKCSKTCIKTPLNAIICALKGLKITLDDGNNKVIPSIMRLTALKIKYDK